MGVSNGAIGRFAFEFFDPLERALLESGGILCDRVFAEARHLRHAAIERVDEIQQVPHSLRWCYRHEYLPAGLTSKRPAFHTSPQFSQRQ